MFRHLLLPTDGSAAAGLALSDALQFARDAGARVTILHVVPEFHVFTYKTDMLEDTRAEFLRDSEAHATRLLEQAAAQARTAGVPCETRMARSDQPHEAITAAKSYFAGPLVLFEARHQIKNRELFNLCIPILSGPPAWLPQLEALMKGNSQSNPKSAAAALTTKTVSR